jgi:hypothetical protein
MKYLIILCLLITGVAFGLDNLNYRVMNQDVWETSLYNAFSKSMVYGGTRSAKGPILTCKAQGPSSLGEINKVQMTTKLPDLMSALSLQRTPPAVSFRK